MRTPRNRTRRDCRDDQQHDRREDLSEGPRAATAGLTEGESFRSKPKREEIMATEYQTGDKIPPRRVSLINPFDPSFCRDRILISVFACRATAAPSAPFTYSWWRATATS